MNNAFKQLRFSAIAAVGSIALLGLPAVVSAQADEWQQDLEDQIEAVESCVVASISNVVERETEQQDKLTAIVECKDGRVFKAAQPDEFLPFSYQLCDGSGSDSCG